MISVIVPVFNEEEGVARTLNEVTAELASVVCPYELIVVNDGSTDRTLEVVRSLNLPHCTVINHVENLGYGKSLFDGILLAKNECIAIIDGDGSYPVKKIKELLAFFPLYDMVVGARQGKEYQKGTFKKPARMLFASLVEYASGRKVPDVNSGLRIFKRSIVLKFQDSLCTGFSFTTTLTLLFLLNHYFIKYVLCAQDKLSSRRFYITAQSSCFCCWHRRTYCLG
jgi:glycosyltransferase involved in cell wall biosynthesis